MTRWRWTPKIWSVTRRSGPQRWRRTLCRMPWRRTTYTRRTCICLCSVCAPSFRWDRTTFFERRVYFESYVYILLMCCFFLGDSFFCRRRGKDCALTPSFINPAIILGLQFDCGCVCDLGWCPGFINSTFFFRLRAAEALDRRCTHRSVTSWGRASLDHAVVTAFRKAARPQASKVVCDIKRGLRARSAERSVLGLVSKNSCDANLCVPVVSTRYAFLVGQPGAMATAALRTCSTSIVFVFTIRGT